IFGSFLGGLVGNWLYNRNPRYMPLLSGIATIIAVAPTLVLIAYPAHTGPGQVDVLGPLLVGMLAGFFAIVAAPNARAMLLNVNAPETRGSIFALYNMADDLGKGFGPFFISTLIVSFGREWAFNVAAMLWLLCGLALLAMIFTFPRDEAALNARLATRAEAMTN
ncbi:MAG: MFS transporter, partial [Myxococcota bacterium]